MAALASGGPLPLLALWLCHALAALALPPALADLLGPGPGPRPTLDAVWQGLRREAGLPTLRRTLASTGNWTRASTGNRTHGGGDGAVPNGTARMAGLLQSLLEAQPHTVSFQDFLKGRTASPPMAPQDIVSVGRYMGVADAVIGQTPIEAIRNRSLVYVNAASGARVATLRQVLGQLTVRVFVLQCNAHTVFEDWLLRSPAVLLLFACNVPLALQAHPKVRIIPLGVPQGTEKQLTPWRRRLPTVRPVREVFVQFSIRSPASRAKVRRALLDLLIHRRLLVLRGPYQRISHEAYLKQLIHSRFVICPRGVGLDTYRTWEALALGRVPVVERLVNPFLYAGLPVVQLDSWQQINSSLLSQAWQAMQNQRVQTQKLSFTWWALSIVLHASLVP